jgi:large conductance mechanosensitive channel
MLREFRDFIARGNVIDLAVAVIMGGAFGAIVTSFVSDVVMPPIGLILGGVDFSNLFVDLSGGNYTSLADAQAAGAATINYGLFLNKVLGFLIVAAAVFAMVKAVNKMQKPKAAAAPAGPPEDVKLLTEIRDLLRAGRQ